MVSVSSQIAFIYKLTDVSLKKPTEDWQLLLGICADFRIENREVVCYSEVEFPVVEFAHHLAKWAGKDNVDFDYESMESESVPLISFKEKDGSYMISSEAGQHTVEGLFTKKSLTEAAYVFIDRLCEDLLKNHRIDVRHLVS